MFFRDWLRTHGYNPKIYLKVVKFNAEQSGYNPDALFFCDDGVHKLEYRTDNKIVKFGRATYHDFILWTWDEFKGLEPEGTGEKKRHNYVKRASNIKGNWKSNPLSPNNLAINILW